MKGYAKDLDKSNHCQAFWNRLLAPLLNESSKIEKGWSEEDWWYREKSMGWVRERFQNFSAESARAALPWIGFGL